MNTYFTSDTHFGHANIIKYCNRPFADAAEMDRALISNWNNRVMPGDRVFHLGDFSLSSGGSALNYLNKLNGEIHLIIGNHEKEAMAVRNHFASVQPMLELSVDGQRMVLCHYAMRVWNKSHRGAWHLYGHSHGTLPDDPESLSFDIGVDCWNYHPVSMEQIRARMAQKRPPTLDTTVPWKKP